MINRSVLKLIERLIHASTSPEDQLQTVCALRAKISAHGGLEALCEADTNPNVISHDPMALARAECEIRSLRDHVHRLQSRIAGFTAASTKTRVAAADAHAHEVAGKLRSLITEPAPMLHLAAILNSHGITSRTGSSWHVTMVRRMLIRAGAQDLTTASI